MTVALHLLVGAVLALFGIELLAAPAPPTPEYCASHYGRPLGEVVTWRTFTFQKYLGDAACESHRQGTYLESNVVVDTNGDLVISAHRDGSAYSVGRVRLTDFRVPASDFEWGFEARLPDESATPGTRSALWLVNLDQIYCDPLWGELDVLEWYASRPDLPEAATHATCADAAYTSWHHKPAAWDWGAAGRTGFHRWAVRKETTERGITISYLYDARVYASDVCEDRLPGPTCSAVLDRGWTAILQTAVFADDSGPFTRPADDTPFPAQELVVRDMWVDPL
jgi:hypothetical protein